MNNISPEDWHLLIEAVVTFLGFAGLYLKMHSGQKDTQAAVALTGAKVDAHLAVANALGAVVNANAWASRQLANDAAVSEQKPSASDPLLPLPPASGV